MAVRVETSTLDDEAAAEPTGVRDLSTWVAWKRETEVLTGRDWSTGGVSGRSRSKMVGPGVEGGEMKATFFWTSGFVLLEVLDATPDADLRGTGVGASKSGAGARAGSFGEVGGDGGPEEAEEGAESRAGGERDEASCAAKAEWTSSGSGLKGGRAAGSGVGRLGCGGGGHCLSCFGWSFSFVPPRWRRWKKAFMQAERRGVCGQRKRLPPNTAKHRRMPPSCPAHATKHVPLLAFSTPNATFHLAQLQDGVANGTALWLGAQCLAAYLAESHLRYRSTPPTPAAIELGSGVGLTACAPHLHGFSSPSSHHLSPAYP